MKPRHVVTFNILFILKRFVLALLLVMYKVLSGNIQTYVIAIVHLVFLFHYCTCWWYMSLFKKILHLTTDLLVFIVLIFPVFQGSFETEQAAGMFIVHFFSACMFICIIACFLALIPKCCWNFGKYFYQCFFGKTDNKLTFPKEKYPYDKNVMVKAAQSLAKKKDTQFVDDFGKEGASPTNFPSKQSIKPQSS